MSVNPFQAAACLLNVGAAVWAAWHGGWSFAAIYSGWAVGAGVMAFKG